MLAKNVTYQNRLKPVNKAKFQSDHIVIDIVHGIAFSRGSNFGQHKLYIIVKPDISGVGKLMLARKSMSKKGFFTLFSDSALKQRLIFWAYMMSIQASRKKEGPCVVNPKNHFI